MVERVKFDRFVVRMHYLSCIPPYRRITDSVEFTESSRASDYYNSDVHALNYYCIELIGCNGNEEWLLCTKTWVRLP